MSTAVATATETTAKAPDQAGVAFEALYRDSRDDVYAYTAGLLRDRSAAEEVTSQAFEKAWRKRRQLKPERGSARAWLFGIARNAALDELRRRSKQSQMPDEIPASRAASTDTVERIAVREAMAGLNGRERELVALKYFAGLSNAEIASVIGTSESNAGTKLHRVVEKLRRSLDEAD